jgi:hypothetical protein
MVFKHYITNYKTASGDYDIMLDWHHYGIEATILCEGKETQRHKYIDYSMQEVLELVKDKIDYSVS